VKQQSDKTCNLTLCKKDDLFVMVSREGYLQSIGASQLPLTIEEAIRLSPSDHIITSFILDQKPAILFVTQNGKIIHREASWLEIASSLKTKGQPIYSRERRAAGIRVVGAAAVSEGGEREWGVSLRADGVVMVHQIHELFATGSIFGGQASAGGEIVGFASCAKPTANGKRENH
jgi:hypothetical protein